MADQLILWIPNSFVPDREGEALFLATDVGLSIGATLCDEPRREGTLRQLLTEQAHLFVRRPLVSQRWTVTNSPMTVEAWPLPHDCDECRAGIRIALDATKQGTWVALGNLEVDPSG